MCDARIKIEGGGTNPVGQADELTVTVEKKDGTNGFTFGPAGNATVEGSLSNQNGAAADFGGAPSCTTSSEGTCTLTVNSDTAGSGLVSAEATNIFADINLADFSVSTDGIDDNSPPALVNWTDVDIENNRCRWVIPMRSVSNVPTRCW